MSDDFKLELSGPGVRSLLKSPEIKAACMKQIQRLQAACGPGYEVDTYTGRTRVNAMICAKTTAAKRDNAEKHTLANAVRNLK